MSAPPTDSDPVHPSRQEHDQTGVPNSNHQGPEGIMASAKSQINSITGGASVTEAKDNVVGAAGQTLNHMKETVVEGAVPAAKASLQTAQDKLGVLVGRNAAEQSDAERIDQLDAKRVSDFLRESHKSTKAPPSKQ